MMRASGRSWRWPTAASSAGEPLGAAGEAAGEVMFNTAMTGYQEILTDPVLPRADRLHDLPA